MSLTPRLHVRLLARAPAAGGVVAGAQQAVGVRLRAAARTIPERAARGFHSLSLLLSELVNH